MQQALEGVAVAAEVEVVERTLVQGTVVVLAPPPRLASAAQTCPHLKVLECLHLLGSCDRRTFREDSHVHVVFLLYLLLATGRTP